MPTWWPNTQWWSRAILLTTKPTIPQTWMQSSPTSMASCSQLTIKIKPAMILKKRSKQICHAWIDSSKWNEDSFTIEYLWCTGRSISSIRKKRKGSPHILVIQSTEISFRDNLECGEQWLMNGEKKESTEKSLHSGKILNVKNWQCGRAKSTNWCFIWLSLKIKLRLRSKREKNWHTHTSHLWTKVSTSSTRRRTCWLTTRLSRRSQS